MYKNFALVILALFVCSGNASAATLQANGSTSIQAFEDWSYNFRDTRTANQSGYIVGDRIAFGIQRLTPNPEQGVNGDKTVVTGTQNGQTFQPVYTPSGGVFNGEYFTSIARPSDGSLDGAWQMKIVNDSDEVNFQTNSISGAGTKEFVNSMALSGDRLTPTFNWSFPIGSDHDSIRLTIHDTTRDADGNLVNPQNPNAPLEEQYAKIVHLERSLSSSATSYGTPETLTDGTSIIPGRTYDVGIQLNEFNNDGFLISRSRAFFGFTPIDAGTATVFLPSVSADGKYQFDVAVEQDVPIIIDPLVAIGYEYEVGLGDPLFSTVKILSDVGDSLYDLLLYDSTSDAFIFEKVLATDELFDFGVDGIERFLISGIEPSAMLDPNDITAFMTELTFENSGQFTGSMTPIVVDVPPVPVPAAIWLFGTALVGFIGMSRRRKVA